MQCRNWTRSVLPKHDIETTIDCRCKLPIRTWWVDCCVCICFREMMVSTTKGVLSRSQLMRPRVVTRGAVMDVLHCSHCVGGSPGACVFLRVVVAITKHPWQVLYPLRLTYAAIPHAKSSWITAVVPISPCSVYISCCSILHGTPSSVFFSSTR
jgi:hypothetical protein